MLTKNLSPPSGDRLAGHARAGVPVQEPRGGEEPQQGQDVPEEP